MQIGEFLEFSINSNKLFLIHVTNQLLFKRPYNPMQFGKLSAGKPPHSHLTNTKILIMREID